MKPAPGSCPLCGHDIAVIRKVVASDTVSPQDMSLRECAGCGLAWQWPLKRSELASVEFFSDGYRAEQEDSYFDPLKKRAICEMELEFVESIVSAKGRLFDIGSGSGLFCQAASERGWEAWGVDPAGPEDDSIGPAGEVHLRKGSIADLEIRSKYNVVTIWDVIEHVLNPVQLIEECKSILEDDGWLFVETGNYKSAGRINEGENWWAYQYDHRWYFSPDTLIRLLKDCGFNEFHLAPRALRPWASGSGSYSGPSMQEFVKASVRRPWRIAANRRQYKTLRKLAEDHHQTAGMAIFAIAARTSS